MQVIGLVAAVAVDQRSFVILFTLTTSLCIICSSGTATSPRPSSGGSADTPRRRRGRPRRSRSKTRTRSGPSIVARQDGGF